jgi:very-short-patch-repair endonuclease
MTERKAVHYGKVEIVPGIMCDAYVLDDGTAVMSERGTADLLGINQMLLNRMKTNWPPKTLKPFVDKGLIVTPKLIDVAAKNSPYQGRQIVVYDSHFIESIIRAYALALANDVLRANQKHIGIRCSILICALILTALEAAIREACGVSTNLPKTAQQHYQYAVDLLKTLGFTFSIDNEIAIKKDITEFLKVKETKLNSFLRKHRDIVPIKLDRTTLRAIGSKALRMNGYNRDDVGKIALSMDSEIGTQLKKEVFGDVSSLAKLDTKGEIEWQKVLTQVFAGFDFHHNCQVGNYRVDFLIKELQLGLECNGYDNHAYYDQKAEAQREEFVINKKYGLVRFHHRVDWESLANGILHSSVGTIIKRYAVGQVYSNTLPASTELKAVYYGKVEIIPGTICDGYILDDDTAVLSERGTADLLGMKQASLQIMTVNGPPKTLKPFVDKGWSMKTNSVKVVAKNSPYQGRNIVVYESQFIESIIRGYTLALANNALRANQKHVGKRCSILACALSQTAIYVAIQQACGFSPNIQKTVQQNYQDAVKSIVDLGFKCSVAGDIAIKKDMTQFLGIPQSTLNSYLNKHRETIKPIPLDRAAIRAANSKAPRMNGYHLDDVGKIVLGMDSVIGIDLKNQIFGRGSSLTELEEKKGREWPKTLALVFAGFSFHQNYFIGEYKVDFFVEELKLVLEFDNGQPVEREQFISQHYGLVRFPHQIGWETLLNGILHAQVGTVVRLNSAVSIFPEKSQPETLGING